MNTWHGRREDGEEITTELSCMEIFSVFLSVAVTKVLPPKEPTLRNQDEVQQYRSVYFFVNLSVYFGKIMPYNGGPCIFR